MKQMTVCLMLYTCHSGITGEYVIPILMNSEVGRFGSKYNCKSICKILCKEICTIKIHVASDQ